MRVTIRITTLLCALVAVTGCTSQLSQVRNSSLPPERAGQVALEQFLDAPAVTQVKVARNAFVLNEPQNAGDDSVVKLDFNKAPLQDVLLTISRAANINILLENHDTPALPQAGPVPGPAAAGNQGSGGNAPVSLTFNGKTKDLFRALSTVTGYFFVYDGNTVFARKDDVFSVLLPTFPKLLESVEQSVKQLGASSVAYDTVSSTLSFRADYNSYLKIKRYLQLLRDNASLISMRVVLVDLTLNKQHNMGVDWSKLAMGHGALQNAAGVSGTISGAAGGAATAVATGTGYATIFNGTGMNLLLDRAFMDVSAVLNFMENFGSYKVVQNVSVLALSGKEGKLEALRETPYVSQISVANLTVGSSSTGQTAQTDKAKDGVEINITPQYNRADGTLGIALKVGVYGVTRFIDLSAGNQLGTLQLPETTKKTVETYLRMTPQQIAVIGGLVSEKQTTDSNGLPIDTYATRTMQKIDDKDELVVIVKPSIVEFVY